MKCSRCRSEKDPRDPFKTCKRCRDAGFNKRRTDFDIDVVEPAPVPEVLAKLPVKCFDSSTSVQTGLKRILFIPDVHIPYHDQKAFAVMLKAAELFKPEEIIILGDWMDFYCLSEFDKHPGRLSQLDQEIAIGNECLTLVDRLNASKKIYIKGNHEDRLERYLMRRAPELHGMVSLDAALKLRERGWEIVEYKQHYKLGEIYVTHDTGRAGRYAAYQSMTDVGDNTVIGHTHRLAYVIEGNAKGRAHVGAMFGWLGDVERVDYMHLIRAKRDWAHGFGVGYQEPNGVVHLRPIPIVEGACVIDGTLVSLAR